MRGARLVLVLLGTVVLGCRVPPLAPQPLAPQPNWFPPWPPVPVRVVTADLDGGTIHDRLEIPEAARTPAPVVLSALGEGKEVLEGGAILATFKTSDRLPMVAGIPPGAPTVGTFVLVSPSPDVIGRQYLEYVVDTGRVVVPRILDWLATVPDVDARRIAITGASTNGLVAVLAAADRRIRAAAVLLSAIDFRCFLQHSSMGLGGAPLALAPDYAAWLDDVDPVRHPGRWVYTRLLVLNTEGDTLFPIHCEDAAAAVFARAYARAGVPHRFRYVHFEGGAHGVGIPERAPALDWLRRWILPPSRRPA